MNFMKEAERGHGDAIKELAECDRTGAGREESGGFCEWEGYE